MTHVPEQDLNLLKMMYDGAPPLGAVARLTEVRRLLFKLGRVAPLLPEQIAIIATEPGYAPPEERFDLPGETSAVLLPSEAELLSDKDKVAFQEVDGVGEYQGGKPVEQTRFKYKPKPDGKVDWKKVEKHRPIMYLSDKLASWQSGRFIKVDLLDKQRIIIRSSEQNKNFGILATNAELSDLSPLSTAPLAVQI